MADELLQMFQSITTNDHDDLVMQFSYILQVKPEHATFYLESSNWNVETAVNTYLATQESLYNETQPNIRQDNAMECDDNTMENRNILQAKLLSDLSQSQATLFAPGAIIHMQWCFRNVGTSEWPMDTQLIFEQGTNFDGPEALDVSSVPVGEQIELHATLRLPLVGGSYAGTWRLRSGNIFFGDPVWVVLNVHDPSNEKHYQVDPQVHGTNIIDSSADAEDMDL